MARGSTLDNDRCTTGQAYEIIKADKNLTELNVDGKILRFPRVHKSMMRVQDRGLAMAIRDKYGKGGSPDVTVTKVSYPDAHDRGHKYFFGQLTKPLPWHKYDENGKRIKEDGKAETQEKENAEGSGQLHGGNFSPSAPNEAERHDDERERNDDEAQEKES